MEIVTALLILVFSTVLCTVEIPKMRKQKQYRELWTFSILLGLGTVLETLITFNVNIPNPSDFIALVYSTISDVTENMFR